MIDLCIGIDTSCYTTSVACVDKQGIVRDERTVLSVSLGERGLRQSEGLFQHIKNLPELIERVMGGIDAANISVVGVSARPTGQDDSYMPVFLAGMQQARGIAAALKVPLYETNHQKGHIRAALVGNEMLKNKPFYAIHLSGGTTDVLSVDAALEPTLLGVSKDIHAGQFVDRIGVLLGCSFPCGKQMEQLAHNATDKSIKIPSSVLGNNCSFSGAESGIIRLIKSGSDKNDVAYGVYDCLARTLAKMIRNVFLLHGERPILLCGGVASSTLLNELLHERIDAPLYFSSPHLASDNAVGVALLALEQI